MKHEKKEVICSKCKQAIQPTTYIVIVKKYKGPELLHLVYGEKSRKKAEKFAKILKKELHHFINDETVELWTEGDKGKHELRINTEHWWENY